jgi:protein SCO1
MTRSTAAVLFTAVAAVALLAGCASGTKGTPALTAGGEPGWHGTAVKKGYPLPAQTFTDTSGRTVTPSDLATTPVTLVFFGYTHCPDICNVVLAHIESALRGATPAVRRNVRLEFITTDPARDTPKVVRGYLDRFDPRYEGLVAPVDTVAKAAKALYISYERPDGSHGGNYTVDHGTYTTGFLHGSARVIWSADTTVADLRADLTRLSRLA